MAKQSFLTALVLRLRRDLVWSDSAKNRYTTLLEQELNSGEYSRQSSWMKPEYINMVNEASNKMDMFHLSSTASLLNHSTCQYFS